MRPTKAILTLSVLCCTLQCFSQQSENIPGGKTPVIVLPVSIVETSVIDDCITTPMGGYTATPDRTISASAKPEKFLIVHGNISYDYFFRSKIDTPFAQPDFQQHTERVSLDVLVNGKYPIKVNLASRQSNSPFFRNFLDLNLQFDRYSYTKNIKQQLLDKLNVKLPERPDLKSLTDALKAEKEKYSQLKSRIQNPATLQRIIEQRERQYNQSLNQQNDIGSKHDLKINQDSILNGNRKDSLLAKLGPIKTRADSLENKFKKVKNNIDSAERDLSKIYENDKARLDSLSNRITAMQKKADSLQRIAQKDIFAARQKIINATSQKELLKIAADNGISTDSIKGKESKLAAIKTFGIGRSMLNYTELTAQNIIINGLNIEYNPSYYAAFAAGKIDYRFRDFFTKNTKKNDQYLVLGRFGFGDKERRALIFTYFQGRKNQSDFVISDSVQNYVNIMGYSVEAIMKKDEHTFISAEFAKSTKPVTGNLIANKQSETLFKLSDKSNMGINLKAQTIIPETNTKLSGFFRKTGQNFQSFSLFSYNTDQTAWSARLDQSFYRNRVSLTGILRQNDFTNPFTEKTYKTTTVFKSVLLSVRIPKYPSLSIGYYPGTQLYFIDKDKIRENAYYIINGSMTYSYFYKRSIRMNTSVVYNRYINQATDSGFVLYEGTNYYAAQTIFLKKLQLQGGYSYNKQPELEYYTLETSADYSVKNWLRLGTGAKYNKVSSGNNYMGEHLQLSVDLRALGSLQVQYEKSFLPTVNRTLYPIETGRVMWYKNF